MQELGGIFIKDDDNHNLKDVGCKQCSGPEKWPCVMNVEKSGQIVTTKSNKNSDTAAERDCDVGQVYSGFLCHMSLPTPLFIPPVTLCCHLANGSKLLNRPREML